MHCFQPLPIDIVELNPFTKISEEWALVSAGNKNNYNTMTVSWGGLGVLWGKNVAFIFVRDSRYTKEFIDNGELFSISFLDEEYRAALKYCGAHSGRDCNKFEEAGLTPAFKLSVPYVDEASLLVLCRKMAAVPLTEDTFLDKSILPKWYAEGDFHTMYIGEIMEVLAR